MRPEYPSDIHRYGGFAAKLAERDALATELAEVKAQLVEALGERDAARYQRDTALARMNRRGW